MMFFEPCKRIKEFKKINNKIKEEIIVIASERDSENENFRIKIKSSF